MPSLPLDPGSVKTLADVLTKSELDSFSPAPDDHESRMFHRMRRLVAQSRHLVALVRVREGILSKAAVMKLRKGENSHNAAEHALAKARQAMQCSSGLQSRHQLWMGFSERAVAELEEQLTTEDGALEKEQLAVAPPTRLGPCTCIAEGARKFQLLVVRPYAVGTASAGGLRYAVPAAAWRAGRLCKARKTKSSGVTGPRPGQKLLACGTLPVHLVTSMHVQLLMPFGSESSGLFNDFFLSFLGWK